MAHLDKLKEAVRKIEEQGDATIALLRGLAEQLRHSKNDAVEIEAIAAQLDSQAQEFSEVISENTPEEPPVEPPVEPPAEPTE